VPPFRADHVGSFLRPAKLHAARKQHAAGAISDERLRAVEDEAVREAAKYVPLDQLCLSGQCGFASTEQGNALTADDQKAKLDLIVATAAEVWG
jgi:methionine synthase II (cobalamin-independent)